MAKLLVVEDDESMALAMLDWFEMEGHQVDLVFSAESALESLQSGTYDVLVTDWGLPKMSGIDLCRQFRSAGGTTPILMLTGKSDIMEKVQGFDAGVDDYITKPFDFRELDMRVKALLKRAAVVAAPSARDTKPAVKIENARAGDVVFDRYEFLSELGRGAMGVVYRARHIHLDRLVAIKVMHEHLAANSDLMNRFNLEARALSGLKHPHIVAVQDFGISPDGQPFLIIDIIEGITLTETLEVERRLSVERAVLMAQQLCDALNYMHGKGVIHRDIKPSNIMLTRDWQGKESSKIVDFGVVKLVAPDGAMSTDKAQTEEIMGSPLYMSPEQCSGAEVDGRTDIYALGCVLYQALTGKMPFPGATAIEAICNRLTQKPLSFQEVCPDLVVPELAETICLKALESEPDNRYQTMDEMRADLSQLQFAISS